MGKVVKIFFVFFVLIILSIIVFGVITYLQIKKVTNLVRDSSIQEKAIALAAGDCTKLPEVEEYFERMEKTLKEVCWNPVLNFLIEKNSPGGKNLCLLIKNPDNEYKKMLDLARDACKKFS